MTGKSQGKRHDLLQSLLIPLVKEWGRDAVLTCIAELDVGSANRKPHRRDEGREEASSSRKPSAVEIADRAELPTAQRAALLRLASLFDRKLFLPTASDVRHFLELRGQKPAPVKQRLDAFRKVLALLSGTADEELQRLIQNSTHAGPTQLGPLSDAIRATGAAMRSADASPGVGDTAATANPDTDSSGTGNSKAKGAK
ncbi:MAG: hypothetical protein ACK52V_12925 [Betaproteobacteria bacterium]|jgi:hypothetical protein